MITCQVKLEHHFITKKWEGKPIQVWHK